jgi:hypothetical protein
VAKACVELGGREIVNPHLFVELPARHCARCGTHSRLASLKARGPLMPAVANKIETLRLRDAVKKMTEA